MIELGKKQVLYVRKIKNFGVYVADAEDTAGENAVLLPGKYVPEGAAAGDGIEVFVYRDSSDRLVATTLAPALTLGETAVLTVSDVGRIGAFLDWGLEKDLLLPFKEQVGEPLKRGDRCLVALYIDKSRRLCATMKVYNYLRADSPYKTGDRVTAFVYQFHSRLGAFAAVDGKYHALLPKGKYHPQLKAGEEVSARVEKVREDGRLTLTMSEPIREQMAIDSAAVMALLDSYDGVLPFTEKASPEVIQRELDMSKAAFKRAVGNLLKHRAIEIIDGKIRKI